MDSVPNYETSATDCNGAGFESQVLLLLLEKDFTFQAGKAWLQVSKTMDKRK